MTATNATDPNPPRWGRLLLAVAAAVAVVAAWFALVRPAPTGMLDASPTPESVASASATPSPTRATSPTASIQPSAEPSPQPSRPSGLTGMLAYVSSPVDPQIFLLDLATGESRQLTHLTFEDAELTGGRSGLKPALSCFGGPYGLSWSPDGSMLAFTFSSDCDGVVYTVEVDGTLHRIGDGAVPGWSPDGSRLVYQPNIPYAPCGVECLDPELGPWELLVADPRGRDEPTALTQTDATFTPSRPLFSPDGSLVAFSGPSPNLDSSVPWSSAAFVIDATGTGMRHVIDGGYATGWAPDGRLIVQLGEPEHSVLVDIATRATEILGDWTFGGPWLSPSGTVLLGTTYDPVADADTIHVRTIPGQHEIATVPGGTATWAPDSDHFVVVDADLTSTVNIYAADGTSVGGFVIDGWVGDPAWRPGD